MGQGYLVGKQDATWMRVKYKAENCEWMLFASKVESGNEPLVMKTMELEHTCCWTFYNERAILGFLARKYVDFLRSNKKSDC